MVQKHLVPLIDSVLNPSNSSVYQVVLSAQRSNHKEFPKLNIDFPFARQLANQYPEVTILTNTIQSYINILSQDSSWTYTGIYTVENPLYENNAELTYYQFVNAKQIHLENWKYIYIPLSYQSTLVSNNLLPSINFYNASDLSRGVIYPNAQELIRIDDFQTIPSFYTNIPNTSLSHPFYPGFYFTGNTTVIKNKLIYEYVDFLGYYDMPYTYYFSERRPLNFEYPYGRINTLSLDTVYLDLCYPNSAGQAPEYLEYTEATPPLLSFEYRSTNRLYSKNTRWFVYTGGKETILQSPPHPNAKAFIEQIYIEESVANPGLTLLETQVYNNQSIFLSQTSDSFGEGLIFDEQENVQP